MRTASILAGAFAVVLAGGTFGTGAAHAQSHPQSCYDRAQSQAALTACASRDARASQARARAAFEALERILTGASRLAALADDRAWRAYVAANCRSVSDRDVPAAGSMAPMNELLCIARRADERTAYLHWRAASPEERNRRPMP